MSYVPRAPRPPRSDELAFLRTIAAQPPSPADQGPVGRCAKRGWCEPVFETSDGRQMSKAELVALAVRPKVVRTIGYVLTEAGRQAAGLPSVAACAVIILEGLFP